MSSRGVPAWLGTSAQGKFCTTDLDEADAWLASARYLFEHGEGRPRHTVVAAECIHAMIRANDALTFRFLRRRSTRHEDAALLFGEVLRQNKIPSKYASLRETLIRAVSEKSEYNYKGTEVSREAAAPWIREATEFIAAIREILK